MRPTPICTTLVVLPTGIGLLVLWLPSVYRLNMCNSWAMRWTMWPVVGRNRPGQEIGQIEVDGAHLLDLLNAGWRTQASILRMMRCGEHKHKKTNQGFPYMNDRRSMQNTLLWVVAVVLINALWLNVANQSAPNEINTVNQFQTYREVEISSVFGSSSPIPAELNTEFESLSVDNANVSFSIKKDNQTEVFLPDRYAERCDTCLVGRINTGHVHD